MRLHHFVLLTILAAACSLSAAAQDRPYSISINGAYTSASELFYNPDSPDELFRSLSYSLDGFFSYGIDLRRRFEDLGVEIGVSVDLLKMRQEVAVPALSSSASGGATAYDGFVAVPVELTGLFRIPFSSDNFELFMGGGGGAYFGNRYYQQAGVTANSVSRSVGFGIHVASELQYNASPSVSLRLGLKFRNVQIKSTNAFPVPYGYENGSIVHLDQTPFSSLINIDGMMASVGLAYRF